MRAKASDDEAIVSVRDNGLGIPKEAMKRLFDLFAQGNGAGAQQGLGVRLHLSRTLVEMHGGRIEGEGSGNGSEFIVHLPLRSPLVAQGG